jgi:hypothetical protein
MILESKIACALCCSDARTFLDPRIACKLCYCDVYRGNNGIPLLQSDALCTVSSLLLVMRCTVDKLKYGAYLIQTRAT